MAEFAADVPDEGKGPLPATAASGGGGREEDSYPLTVFYCGGGFDAETLRVCYSLDMSKRPDLYWLYPVRFLPYYKEAKEQVFVVRS